MVKCVGEFAEDEATYAFKEEVSALSNVYVLAGQRLAPA